MVSTNIPTISHITLKSIFIICFVLSIGTGLKLSQTGVNDWHLKNIGEITKIQYLSNNRIFFLSNFNSYGYLNRQTGQIVKRSELKKGEAIISFNQHQFIVSTPNNQVLTYSIENLQKSVDIKFMDYKQQMGLIQGYAKLHHNVYATGSKQLRLYNHQLNTQEIIAVADQNQKLVGLTLITSQDNNNKLHLLVSKNNSQICLLQIQNNNFLEPSNCFKLDNSDHIQLIQVLKSYICIETVDVQSSLCINTLDYSFIRFQQIPLTYSQKHINLNNGSYSLKLKTYSPYWSMEAEKQSQLKIHQDQQSINIYRGDLLINSLKIKDNHHLLRSWIHFKSEFQYQVTIQYSDLQLAHYKHRSQQEELKWVRQQSLAYIDKILFIKEISKNQQHHQNQYHRKVISHQYQSLSLAQKIAQIPNNLILRVIFQLTQIKNFLSQFINEQLPTIFNLEQYKKQEIWKFKMSQAQERNYGLRKTIIIVTKYNTMYAMDTKTSNIIWKKNINLKSRQLVSLIKMKSDYEKQKIIMITFSNQDGHTYIDEITKQGQIVRLKSISTAKKPSIHKLNQYSILLKVDNLTIKYEILRQNEEIISPKQYYFYKIQGNIINGYQQKNNVVMNIWNVNLSPKQKIIASASSYSAEKSRIPIINQQKVIFKNVDYTNFAVLSKSGNIMNVYVINGKTGHIQFNQYQSGVSFSHAINLAYDENNILITYFSLKNRVYEIWTIEQYQDRIETSIINIVKQYYINKQPINSIQSRQNIIFQSQIYGSTVPIKNFFISQSKDSLIRRNMIIITPTNQIYSLRRDLISARRPHSSVIFSNPNYFPYEYLLPFDSTSYLTYNTYHISNLETVRFSASEMQSTILILAYGVDVFFIRNSPDKTFDMITDQFNYIVLIVIVIAVTAVVYLLKRKAQNAKIKKPHVQ